MAFKLVYTSAPKGLKEGSFGFCTVGCSRNLSERTIAALEAFSGYRRLYADADSAALNPVAYSHVLLDDGETTLRVLSRIADAGLDYSNRNNKIASHLVLGHTELREVGPAAFFSEPDLFDKRWEGAPQIYDAPFVLPKLTSNVNSCDEWKRETGDPGWAGVLAAAVYTDRPVVLVVRPDQNVLALYQEALELLPPVMRWQATFSTYYTKTPPGIRCQWKATILGSIETQTTRAIPNVLVLDLTSPQTLKPESVDSSPQAFGLIKAAREPVGSIRSSVRSSSSKVAASVVDARPNDKIVGGKTDASDDVQPLEKSDATLSSNRSFATSAKKILDYGRDLPLKNFFYKNLKDQKRWRIVGVASIGVFALIALIVIGINLANFAGKQAQNLPKNGRLAHKDATQDVADDKSKTSATSDASRKGAKESATNRKVDFNAPSIDRQEEKASDPFVFDDENNQTESDVGASSTKDSSDAFASTSQSTEEKKEEPKEKVDDGTDLSDEISQYSSKSARSSNFLSSESNQTIEKFKTSAANRGFAVDFGLFQRKDNKNGESLDGELSDESQELLSDVLQLCKKYDGKLKASCDLSADQNNERQWTETSQRINRQEFSFSNTESSHTKKIIFKTSDRDKKTNGFFSIEIDSQGKLSFHTSDEETRNYFLRSCRLKWTIELPSPNETDKNFVAETEFAQLLKPCEFDLLKGSQFIASAIRLADDGTLPLAVQDDLAYYDPSRNSNLTPALLVLLNPDSKPSAFEVDSQMDDKKKSIVFVFKLRAENIEAFRIRFTRNSQVVKVETVLDKESLSAQLEDFYAKQSYSAFPYGSSSSTPQDKMQNAKREIELTQNRKISFDFYLVATTGKEQYDKKKFIFIGRASVTPSDLAQKDK